MNAARLRLIGAVVVVAAILIGAWMWLTAGRESTEIQHHRAGATRRRHGIRSIRRSSFLGVPGSIQAPAQVLLARRWATPGH